MYVSDTASLTSGMVNTGDPHHKFVAKSIVRLGHRPLDRSVITGVRPAPCTIAGPRWRHRDTCNTW